jgi:diacylglycerol kinase (ATP)
VVYVNKQMCIHLADIGFNAFVVKKFEAGSGRGMWGYIKASFHVLRNHSKMTATINVNNKEIQRDAAMIVIANATRYGSGAVINPEGRLDDDLFEVIVVKKISLGELFKMIITHKDFDPKKTEVFQTNSLQIHSKKAAHFQVDGEYLGKTSDIAATIMPQALQVLVSKKNAPGAVE